MEQDYTATAETITLHGLGFIQIKLGGNQRMHVWHPELPRRACYDHSQIHNHRFAFRSRILKGKQVNVRCVISAHRDGDHDVISHAGARAATGSRASFISHHAFVYRQMREVYKAGQEYVMDELEYHYTPNDGVVVTVITKLDEGKVHASSVITRGREFDQTFDRFQLSADELWAYVKDALK